MPSFFDRFRSDKGSKDPGFKDWPAPRVVSDLPVVRPGTLRSLTTVSHRERSPHKYGRTILVALGQTGEAMLREWLALVERDPAGPQEDLRAIYIGARSVEPFSSECVRVRQFDLALAQQNLPAWRTQREMVYLLFRQFQNYRPFEEYLHVCLTELKSDIRVVVAGSAAEPEIGLLGPVLQAFRLASATGIGGSNHISAILSLHSPQPNLSRGELYAALREIGRFTFGGPQWMDAPIGVGSGVVRTALLDDLFVIEARGQPPHAPDLTQTPYEEGMQTLLGEILFTFLHPSAKLLWNNLATVPTAEIRNKTHRAVLHAIGIATLQVPGIELEDYAAARLAKAVLFGENDELAAEAFVARTSAPRDYSAGAELARDWLGEHLCEHPLFEWLLGRDGPESLARIPSLSPDYKAAFRAQVTYGLVKLLNERQATNHLARAQDALRWLEQRFKNLQDWYKSPSQFDYEAADRKWFQDFLDDGLAVIHHLAAEIDAWWAALYPSQTGGFATAGFGRAEPATLSGWWKSGSNLGQKPAPGEGSPVSRPAKPPVNLSAFLDDQRKEAEAALRRSAQGRVRRSVIAGEVDELKEARHYYENTIRPELAAHKVEPGPAFNNLRDRLGWWASLAGVPRLFLVFVPPEEERSNELAPYSSTSLYTPDRVEALGRALTGLGKAQASALASDLAGEWLRERFVQQSSFLTRAGYPVVQYDQTKVALQFSRTMRQSYLIGGDRTITGTCKGIVFPNLSAAAINELDGGEATRLTALTLDLNIPVDMLASMQDDYSSYAHQETLHLYPQEAIATRYERRIRSLQGWTVLPPDLVVLMVDQQLLTLFFQAAFCGLIDLCADELGQRNHWSVLPLSESIGRLSLAPEDSPNGLLDAMRAFVLELPNAPGLESQFSSHFHASRRRIFLETLGSQARGSRRKAEFRRMRETFEARQMADWIERGREDAQARGFASMMQVELEEPLWKDW